MKKKTKRIEISAKNFSANTISWIVKNADKIHLKFAKKYPLARNKFHIKVLDNQGNKRTIVWKADGRFKVDYKNSYHNTLPWPVVRKLGAPIN